MAKSIFGTPAPGHAPQGAEAGNGRGLVRLGRFADRRNRGGGTVRHVTGHSKTRAFGNSTSGSVSRVGRQSNRSK